MKVYTRLAPKATAPVPRLLTESGGDLPRPGPLSGAARRDVHIFNRENVATLRAHGLSIRAITQRLVGGRDSGDDAAGSCQKFVACVWNRAAETELSDMPVFLRNPR
jgi:hypothetical protein